MSRTTGNCQPSLLRGHSKAIRSCPLRREEPRRSLIIRRKPRNMTSEASLFLRSRARYAGDCIRKRCHAHHAVQGKLAHSVTTRPCARSFLMDERTMSWSFRCLRSAFHRPHLRTWPPPLRTEAPRDDSFSQQYSCNTWLPRVPAAALRDRRWKFETACVTSASRTRWAAILCRCTASAERSPAESCATVPVFILRHSWCCKGWSWTATSGASSLPDWSPNPPEHRAQRVPEAQMLHVRAPHAVQA